MTRQVQPTEDPRTNLLLKMLEPADYQALIAKGKVVMLKLGKRLYQQDDPVDAVYFPITCMVSLLVSTKGKQPRLELATVGREGVVGAIEVLQSQGALGVHLIQIPGQAIRISARAFLTEIVIRPQLERFMHMHMYALTRQILQGAACNHLHSMEQRCARWILMSHDRASQDTFPLTQEFLSHMLGVRRATVNEASGILRKAGLISFVRGKLTVLDRQGLEAATCSCYGIVLNVYSRMVD